MRAWTTAWNLSLKSLHSKSTRFSLDICTKSTWRSIFGMVIRRCTLVHARFLCTFSCFRMRAQRLWVSNSTSSNKNMQMCLVGCSLLLRIRVSRSKRRVPRRQKTEPLAPKSRKWSTLPLEKTTCIKVRSCKRKQKRRSKSSRSPKQWRRMKGKEWE